MPRRGYLRRKPKSVFTKRHKEFLKSLNETVRARNRTDNNEETKRKKVADFSTTLRSAILNGKSVRNFWKPARVAACLQETRKSLKEEIGGECAKESRLGNGSKPCSGAPWERNSKTVQLPREEQSRIDAEMEAWVDDLLSQDGCTEEQNQDHERSQECRLMEVENSSPMTGQDVVEKKTPGLKGKSKPPWALSGKEAMELDKQEEEDLLQFAESLDFDKYISDMDDIEIKEALQNLQNSDGKHLQGKEWKQNFVRVLNHVTGKKVAAEVQQNLMEKSSNIDKPAHDDQESRISRPTVSHLSKIRSVPVASTADQENESNWDSCTRIEDAGQGADLRATAKTAEELLDFNPDMKSVHSVASVRTLMTRSCNS